MSNSFVNRALIRKGARGLADRRKPVGHTKWGQSWLQPLLFADQQDRLGRGLIYAQQGAVEGIVLAKAGQLSARVKGSQSALYTVQLSLKPITPAQVGDLVTEIARRPTWLDELLSGKLPEGIELTLRSTGVQLFPKDFADLQLSCSCPDSASPCKHSAAVLYELAQHIDEQPMLLFTLRGLDLERQLNALAEVDGLAPIRLEELMHSEENASDKVSAQGEGEAIASLSSGTDFGSLWRQLLPVRPSFFEGGDLADLYHGYLQKARVFWSDYSADGQEDEPRVALFSAYPFQPWELADVRITLDATGGFAEAEMLNKAGEILHVFSKEVQLIAFAERVGERLPVLAKAYRLARQLVQIGAVVPRILQLNATTYRARWQAAVQDESVAVAVAQLHVAAAGQPMVRYRIPVEREETDEAYRARLGREVLAEMEGNVAPQEAPDFHYTYPTAGDSVHALLGVFLRPMMLAGVEAVFAKAEFSSVQLLFFGRPTDFANTGDAQEILALQLWLARLHRQASSHRLVVQVEELTEQPGAFEVGVLVLLDEQTTPAPVAVSRVFEGEFGDALRLGLLREVALLAEVYRPLSKLLESPVDQDFIRLYGGDFAEFVQSILPALRLVGAQLLLPRGLEKLQRPKLSAAVVVQEVKAEEKRPPGLLGLKSLVRFDWQVAVGDVLLTADEFAQMAENFEGIVRLRDGFVWLEATQTLRLLDRLAKPPQPAPAVVLQAILTEEWQGAPLHLSPEVIAFRENLSHEPEVVEGQLSGLEAVLRPYQETGFAWLLRNVEAGLGCLLADDMGLGKTLQTIALLEHFRATVGWSEMPALVVLPTSLLTNWRRELTRFAPQLNVAIYHGPSRKSSDYEGADVVLTSYGTVRSDVDALSQNLWGALIIDEAQQIKNPEAAQTEAIKQLEAPIRIALSGTPVENRLSEYWSVLDFANPGYLGPLEQFEAIYARPIEQDRDREQLEKFRKITAPFILRRLKTDRSVIKDLPEKITQLDYCALAPAQAALYQQVIETQLRELSAAEPQDRRGRMLKFMMAVKQVCNHPYHYLKQGDKSISASGKAQRMMELVKAALDVGERVLIFTQYREMGELIAELLHSQLGWTPPFLHGGLSRPERDVMVEGMQNDGAPILILSIKAGGTGLNLTAANHVIHYDLWWNPAVESQATDRAFRIGQRRNVLVHRLICAGTFEDQIDKMLEEKKELAELAVGVMRFAKPQDTHTHRRT